MKPLHAVAVVFACLRIVHAQVNSGSDGHDGALNPTTNIVINMADHPDGIYHYTSVNIGPSWTVSFIPNSNNTPVVWLVQSNCSIAGYVFVGGGYASQNVGGVGGPGGFRGGNGGTLIASAGQGPGGGALGGNSPNASFGSFGTTNGILPGPLYGNSFLLPLIGGSGGGGTTNAPRGGGGGGGAILIAASGTILLDGQIDARGVPGDAPAGCGSGGAVRLVAQRIQGNGSGRIDVSGGSLGPQQFGGSGRARLDAQENLFGGIIYGVWTQGFQPVIIPPPNQAVSLAILTVAGVAVSPNPSGAVATPDVIVPGQQANPVSIVVRCGNIPLNTQIIVEIKPANGPTIQAIGLNNVGTQASSTATVQVDMPRGGGTIQAKAVSGIALSAAIDKSEKVSSLAQTGWTTTGERFAGIEITSTLGAAQQVAYLTESGKRYTVPSR